MIYTGNINNYEIGKHLIIESGMNYILIKYTVIVQYYSISIMYILTSISTPPSVIASIIASVIYITWFNSIRIHWYI